MAFLLQDDNGSIDNANAYISVAYYKSYADDRGISYAGKSDSDIEKAIVLSTDYLDTRFSFEGDQWRVDQGTQFPRIATGQRPYSVYEKTPLTGLPKALKDACCLLVKRVLAGTSLMPDPTYEPTGQQVSSTKKKVGPVETETHYDTSKMQSVKPIPEVELVLRNGQLLGGTYSRRIYRG